MSKDKIMEDLMIRLRAGQDQDVTAIQEVMSYLSGEMMQDLVLYLEIMTEHEDQPTIQIIGRLALVGMADVYPGVWKRRQEVLEREHKS